MNSAHPHQKILIVDDKKANLFALEKILKDVDAEVIQAIDGQAALTQVLNHNFALIILDVRMPGMDGYEVAQHLQGDRDTKNIPIIFVTAEYPDEEHMFKGYEAGAIDYLLKPYSSKILLSKVRILMEMDRNRAELQKHRDALEERVGERTAELAAANKELLQYSWLLDKEMGINTAPSQPSYADLTALNHNGLILNTVGAETLRQMTEDVMDLLDTSMAVYEKNGDYAFVSFVSSWCGSMDKASRGLCETDDNRKALHCGKWLCHESCWEISQKALVSGEPADEACCGGLRIYAVPIQAGGQIIGAINFGYGTPPQTPEAQKDLAESYQLDPEIIQHHAERYKPRPPFIINVAKRRLQSIARLIGEIIERKLTEDALHKNERLLNQTGAMAKVGGWEIDFSSNTVLWTQTTKDIHEVPDDYEPTLEEAIAFFAPEGIPALTEAIQRARNEGIPFDMQLPFITAKSRKRWVHTRSQPEMKDGKCIRLEGIFQDITERKQAEDALRASESLKNKMVANIGDVIVIIDQDRVNRYKSPNIQKWFGWEPEDVVGFDALIHIHPDHLDRAGKFIATLMETPDATNTTECLYRCKDGSYKWIEFTGVNLLHDPDIQGVLGNYHDITERKQAVEKLRESEEMMRNSQAVAKICAYSTNLNIHKIEESVWVCSPEFYKIFGIDENYPHTIAGWADFIHPDDRKEVFDYHESVVKEKKSFNREYRIIRINDGEERWVHGTGELEFDKTGKPIRMHGAIQDITEQKLLGDQYLHAQKMDAVGRLAGGMAHDFNNMLQVILGFTEMLIEKTGPDSPLADDLQTILYTGLKSSSLVKQLLTFARKEIISPEILDLNVTIEEMLKMLRRLIGENIELSWHPGEEIHPIRVDPSQINQVVANLCINARDAIDGVGEITLKTGNSLVDAAYCVKHPEAEPGSYVTLTLSDTGCGMDANTLENIFEPFFTTKEIGKGTGLGLSTVYGILQQNNGFVEVQSKPGKGTEFKIFFPRVDTGNTTVSHKIEEEVREGAGETILLVEDEPTLLKVCTLFLQKLGYRVLAAESPQKALILFIKHQKEIHLLLTDIVMPEMNGKQLLEKIRIAEPDMKVLFMSGYDEGIIEGEGIHMKDAKLIAKPFTYADLAKALHTVLNKTES